MTQAGASVLIAGCGYLGLPVARSLSAGGATVFCITRSDERAGQFSNEGLVPVRLTLGDETGWPELPPIETLIWLVGFDQRGSRSSVWVAGFARLLRSFKVPPKRIIYASSVSVYGDAGGAVVDEESATSPITEGGLACLDAEAVLRDFAEHTGSRATALRFAGIYGPARLLRSTSDTMAGKAIESPPNEWLNLVHVDDALQTVLDVGRLSAPPHILNVVASEPLLRRDYYQELSRLLNAPPPTFKPSGSRARSGSKRVVSGFRESLGIEFRFDSAQAGLFDAVARTNKQSAAPVL
jgi:nucleoside-diphosphate-sugar epimerase